MKFGKRRKARDAPDAPDATVPSAESAPSPATESWTAPATVYSSEPEQQPVAEPEPLIYAEPVVEGEAVELPPVEPAAPVYEPPIPVTVQEHTATPSEPMPFANGHAAAGPGPNWQEPLIELADQRPEVVVGAAFAGGVLAAMILRRLGN
jgi:hypothetical protein